MPRLTTREEQREAVDLMNQIGPLLEGKTQDVVYAALAGVLAVVEETLGDDFDRDKVFAFMRRAMDRYKDRDKPKVKN